METKTVKYSVSGLTVLSEVLDTRKKLKLKDGFMMNNDKIYIIDDNEDRSDKLRTLFNFIDKATEVLTFAALQKKSDLSPPMMLLGASASQEQTISQLDYLAKQYSQVPFLLIDAKLTASQCADRNVIACLNVPFTYTQLLDALHRCQIAHDTMKSLTTLQNKTPLSRLVGNSDSIRLVRRLIGQVANTDAASHGEPKARASSPW